MFYALQEPFHLLEKKTVDAEGKKIGLDALLLLLLLNPIVNHSYSLVDFFL